MFKQLAAVSAFALCFAAAGAIAQTNSAATAGASSAQQANLPVVDTMTCEQMQSELTTDGQIMRSQLDPQFGVDAQNQYNDAMQKEKEAQAQAMSPGAIIACMIPFMCHVPQQQQQQNATAEAAQNQAQMQTQMNRLNNSMNGLDQARMQAISNRFEAQHCQTPH